MRGEDVAIAALTEPKLCHVTSQVLALAVVALSIVGAGCSSKPATHSDGESVIVLEVEPSRPEFRLSEQVDLSLTLTNASGSSCRLSTIPDGVVSIVSLTRDEKPITPALGGALYYKEFDAYLGDHLVAVGAGESIEVSLASETDTAAGTGHALRTSASDGYGGAAVAWWPVDLPGTYEVTVGVIRPPTDDAPADSCSRDLAQGSTSFRVGDR